MAQSRQSHRLLSVTLDVWNIGSQDPRGVVNLKHQYAQAAALLVEADQLQVCYAGDETDRKWLLEKELLGRNRFRYFRIPGRLQRLMPNLGFLPVSGMLGSADLYHIARAYPFRNGRTRVIGTLIDFVPMRVPEFVPLAFTSEQVQWCHWATRHPDARWIAISEQTKQDALTLGRLQNDQVSMVYPGVDDDIFFQPPPKEVNSILESLGIRQPYLLYVSTLNLRKNHIGLLEAWEKGGWAKQGWSLVLVGHPAGHPLVEKIQSGIFEGVKWLGYVPRQKLVHLYYGCEAFIYPSLYEGFGIPVAEAVVAGKAVLTSRRSAMTEITRDGAVYIDPWDTQSLIEGLDELIKNETLRKDLAEYNTARRQNFSMQRVADDLMQVYKRYAV
ncbi:MAG: glycosyltransferase family 4 protein [Chloroflexi bacterium]|nr:glycosyltransferase family 4 protein [Chloroflexota bacterium]